MTKPDWCPEDVWETVVWSMHGGWDETLVETVARLVISERDKQREKDAVIAEEQAKLFLSPEYASNQPMGSMLERFACEEVASAIRSNKTGE